MTLNDYCDAINAELKVRRYPNQGNRWTASFEHCEIKEGNFLSGEYGNARSPSAAIKDYASKISGKRIVFNATSVAGRREFDVPENLEVTE